MNLYEDNKDFFIEMREFINGMEEYGHIFEGYRLEEVHVEINKIRESMQKLNDILKDNWDI